VFVRYVRGEVKQLPWCRERIDADGESGIILTQLQWLNRHGFLTINSQPRVNGAPSDDERVGWGGKGGYVFQKAYVEFFVDPRTFAQMRVLLRNPAFASLSFHAVNAAGEEFTNYDKGDVNAVTWGVFPGREVLQPTVVDPESFRVWKDEAFDLWISQWAEAYREPEHAASRRLIESIHESYFLVNIVDNDYAGESANVFALFKRLVADGMSREQLRARIDELEAESCAASIELRRIRGMHAKALKRLRSAREDNAKLMAQNQSLRAQTMYNHDVALAVSIKESPTYSASLKRAGFRNGSAGETKLRLPAATLRRLRK
jgi:hypothetical protein